MVVKLNGVDGAPLRRILQRHQQMSPVENLNLRRATRRGRAEAVSQFERGRAILPLDLVAVKRKRVDRGRAGDVHVIVAKIDTYRRAGRRHQLVKLEAISLAPVNGNGPGSIFDRPEELALLLFYASAVTSDPTRPVGRQGLEQAV